MRIDVAYELVYECPRATPMIFMLKIHQDHAGDIVAPDHIVTDPIVPIDGYRDGFGNWCARVVVPEGRTRVSARASLDCRKEADASDPSARQVPVEFLPPETLTFLLGSRYCETDRLSQAAWDLFGGLPEGWERVQGICDYVHRLITFDYGHADPTKSALGTFEEKAGVCRDFAHLAVAFSRCMNIPARYCTGYLADIGVPQPDEPMDFAAWMEVYLDSGWYIFDPRNNARRIGRILIARGRDAADVPISHSFGPNELTTFRVWADEVPEPAA